MPKKLKKQNYNFYVDAKCEKDDSVAVLTLMSILEQRLKGLKEEAQKTYMDPKFLAKMERGKNENNNTKTTNANYPVVFVPVYTTYKSYRVYPSLTSMPTVVHYRITQPTVIPTPRIQSTSVPIYLKDHAKTCPQYGKPDLTLTAYSQVYDYSNPNIVYPPKNLPQRGYSATLVPLISYSKVNSSTSSSKTSSSVSKSSTSTTQSNLTLTKTEPWIAITLLAPLRVKSKNNGNNKNEIAQVSTSSTSSRPAGHWYTIPWKDNPTKKKNDNNSNLILNDIQQEYNNFKLANKENKTLINNNNNNDKKSSPNKIKQFLQQQREKEKEREKDKERQKEFDKAKERAKEHQNQQKELPEDQMSRVANQNPGQVVLVALAPNTTINRMLEKEPNAGKNFKECIFVYGNDPIDEEDEISRDPEATVRKLNLPTSRVPEDQCLTDPKLQAGWVTPGATYPQATLHLPQVKEVKVVKKEEQKQNNKRNSKQKANSGPEPMPLATHSTNPSSPAIVPKRDIFVTKKSKKDGGLPVSNVPTTPSSYAIAPRKPLMYVPSKEDEGDTNLQASKSDDEDGEDDEDDKNDNNDNSNKKQIITKKSDFFNFFKIIERNLNDNKKRSNQTIETKKEQICIKKNFFLNINSNNDKNNKKPNFEDEKWAFENKHSTKPGDAAIKPRNNPIDFTQPNPKLPPNLQKRLNQQKKNSGSSGKSNNNNNNKEKILWVPRHYDPKVKNMTDFCVSMNPKQQPTKQCQQLHPQQLNKPQYMGQQNVGQPQFMGQQNLGQPRFMGQQYIGQPQLMAQQNLGQPRIMAQQYIGQPQFMGQQQYLRQPQQRAVPIQQNNPLNNYQLIGFLVPASLSVDATKIGQALQAGNILGNKSTAATTTTTAVKNIKPAQATVKTDNVTPKKTSDNKTGQNNSNNLSSSFNTNMNNDKNNKKPNFEDEKWAFENRHSTKPGDAAIKPRNNPIDFTQPNPKLPPNLQKRLNQQKKNSGSSGKSNNNNKIECRKFTNFHLLFSFCKNISNNNSKPVNNNLIRLLDEKVQRQEKQILNQQKIIEEQKEKLSKQEQNQLQTKLIQTRQLEQFKIQQNQLNNVLKQIKVSQNSLKNNIKVKEPESNLAVPSQLPENKKSNSTPKSINKLEQNPKMNQKNFQIDKDQKFKKTNKATLKKKDSLQKKLTILSQQQANFEKEMRSNKINY